MGPVVDVLGCFSLSVLRPPGSCCAACAVGWSGTAAVQAVVHLRAVASECGVATGSEKPRGRRMRKGFDFNRLAVSKRG